LTRLVRGAFRFRLADRAFGIAGDLGRANRAIARDTKARESASRFARMFVTRRRARVCHGRRDGYRWSLDARTQLVEWRESTGRSPRRSQRHAPETVASRRKKGPCRRIGSPLSGDRERASTTQSWNSAGVTAPNRLRGAIVQRGRRMTAVRKRARHSYRSRDDATRRPPPASVFRISRLCGYVIDREPRER